MAHDEAVAQRVGFKRFVELNARRSYEDLGNYCKILQRILQKLPAELKMPVVPKDVAEMTCIFLANRTGVCINIADIHQQGFLVDPDISNMLLVEAPWKRAPLHNRVACTYRDKDEVAAEKYCRQSLKVRKLRSQLRKKNHVLKKLWADSKFYYLAKSMAKNKRRGGPASPASPASTVYDSESTF